MSKAGIKLAANVFSFMQETRGELLRLAAADIDHGSRSCHQDILLAQLMEEIKEQHKTRFMEIIG